MLGTVEKISCEGGLVKLVDIRLPSRGSAGGQQLRLRTLERIGQGSFGTVYRAVSETYPRLALKIATGKSERLRQELDVLSKVCTKGKLLLPRFEFGAINKEGDLIAVGMELCVPRTLHDLLLMTRLTSEADMLFVGYQVVKAVACVHEQRCIHRDVKLQNFVFDLDGNLKLIDFGLASSVWNPPPGDVVAGTISFMAPEMAHNALHRDRRVSVGAAADVWSMGIVLFSIFTQRNPYPTENSAFMSQDSDNDDDGGGGNADGAASATLPKDNLRLLRRVASADWGWPVGSSVSNELRQLVEFILIRDPEKRPDVVAVLSRPIWNSRRRSPPAAITAFLGVQDDFFLSHDEEHLLRAVEQRSADVTASLMGSRMSSPVREETEAGERSSLKFVAKEEVAVGGVPMHQLYDVRREAKQKKPVRDISVVMAEETARGFKRARSRQSKDAATSASRCNSGTRSRVNSRVTSRATSLTSVHPSDERNENGEKEVVSPDGVLAPLMHNNDEREPPQKKGRVGKGNAPRGKKTTPVQERLQNGANSEGYCTQQRGCKLAGKEMDGAVKTRRTSVAQGTLGISLHRSTQPLELRTSIKKMDDNKEFEKVQRISTSAKESCKGELSNAISNDNLVTLVSTETVLRRLEEQKLLLEHDCFLCHIKLLIEEDQGWYNISWLKGERQRSAAHPHYFKETSRTNKKYQYGFVCDMCDFEFLPDGKHLHFFHCACGRDLCLGCHEAYSRLCTCTVCGKVFKNSVALRDHHMKGICKPAGVRDGRLSSNLQQPTAFKSGARKATVTGARTKASQMTTSATTTNISSAATATRMMTAAGNTERGNVMGLETGVAAAAGTSSAASLFNRPINTLPMDEWKPMERLSVSYKQTQPTAEEREVLLNGDWIRYFYLFPMEEEVEPLAFTYHIQPGRTGAIFLNQSFSMHSAVISVVEHQMLIVDYVDTQESKDVARAVSLLQAKCIAGDAYNLLQRVVAYDCNMIKQRRTPGTMSVYLAPQTAHRCQGDPFVYVRWFRFDTQRSLSAFLLSNGAVQVFVGDKYEIRWFDENRKLVVRSNGVCEIMDDTTFPLASEINRLLYDEF